MPLRAVMHDPFIIEQWRAELFEKATLDALEQRARTVEAKEGRWLQTGCRLLANRASRYEVESTESALDAEEAAVIEIIGQARLLEISNQAPPKGLIDYMLSGGTDKYVRPKLDSITVAVIKGQLPWEDRFAEAGVPTPADFIAQSEERAARRQKKVEPPKSFWRRLSSE